MQPQANKKAGRKIRSASLTAFWAFYFTLAEMSFWDAAMFWSLPYIG